MNKNNIKVMVGAVVVVIIVVALILGTREKPQESATESATSSASNGANTPGNTGSGTSAPAVASPSSPAASYMVLSPKAGEQWVLEQPHTISWNKAANVTGEVYLVDAFTNVTVGWINSGTGEKATSTAWDTKHLALTRGGGLQKIVGRGTYFIRIKFDRNQGMIRSGAFSLISADEVTHNTYQVSLNAMAVSPATITVKKGDTIVFVNDDDAITYQIVSPNIFGPYKLTPGQSSALVVNLKPGTYPYTDQLHANITGKIVVQ